ncbi:hypothetical protein OEZ86_013574 [Tetradesmus obliquus]|nr:hypothetical protein OEZ86_013574 [Tetradesmus obliquus]
MWIWVMKRNAISAFGSTNSPFHSALVTGAGKAPAAALAAYAGHGINSALFPWNQPARYDTLIATQLKNVSAADRKAAADIALPVADKLLRKSAGGEFSRWPDFKPAPEGTPFAYQFVPNQTFAIYAQAKDATPWLLTYEEADQIAYNKDPNKGPVFEPSHDDYLATVDLGRKDSLNRTQEQTDIAWFWSLAGNTTSTSGIWLDIGREVLPDDFSIEDTALFYARAAAVNWDAQLVGWRIKYTTLHWRPTTAFRQGFPGFQPIPDWSPLIRVPSHPEYPSGHTISGGALAEVLRRQLGRDDVPFSIASDSTPWLGKRSFKSFSQAAEEGSISRLYGGVHFPSANNDGLKVGEVVAAWVWDRVQPGQPIKLQKPKHTWGWDKDSKDAKEANHGKDAAKDGKDGKSGKSAPSAAGQKPATATSLRKPWLTVDLGRK